MPAFSTRWMAWLTASSMSTSFWASSCARSRRASPTFTRRRRVRPGITWESMFWRLMPTSSMPWPPNIWSMGGVWLARSSSITRSSSLPSRSWARSFSRVASRETCDVSISSSVLEVKASPGRRGKQEVEEPLLGEGLGPLAHLGRHLGLHHVHGQLGEVADHGLHIASHVPHLGVLGGFHLEERGLGEAGEPARDLRLPHPGGADHDDVLRRHLVAQLGREILAPPAVAERDGHRPLGAMLAHDVAVQLGDDLGRGERAHGKASTVM